MTDEERLAVAEAMQKQLAFKEHFIAQYLERTKSKIEDTTLVEQRLPDGGGVRYWCEPKKPKLTREEFRRALFNYLVQKYAQRQDARHKALGLQYTEAETHDLADEITKFAYGL